jgi:hypothetical protein
MEEDEEGEKFVRVFDATTRRIETTGKTYM